MRAVKASAKGATVTLKQQTEKREFDYVMRLTYDLAVQLGYHPFRYLQMLRQLGGLGTAQKLLNAHKVSAGFLQLEGLGRLDLSVEAIVLTPKFQDLFTADQLATARQRLTAHGYTVGKA